LLSSFVGSDSGAVVAGVQLLGPGCFQLTFLLVSVSFAVESCFRQKKKANSAMKFKTGGEPWETDLPFSLAHLPQQPTPNYQTAKCATSKQEPKELSQSKTLESRRKEEEV
jgi:hypothetical protein